MCYTAGMNISKIMLAAAIAAGLACAADTVPGYVQDGLVGHWDAIDNMGTGTHDPTATTWKDLVSGIAATKVGDAAITVEDNHYHFSGKGSYFLATIASFIDDMTANGGFTIEYVSSYTSLSDLGIGVRMGGSGMYYQGGNITYTVATGQRGSWKTPGAGTVFTGTIVYEKDCAGATVRPHYNGRYDWGNPAITWTYNYVPDNNLNIGNFAGTHAAVGDIYAVRIYNRRLTADEVRTNRAVDARRFPRPGGWQSALGFYPYVYPLYIADVATGGSNSIDEVTFKKLESADATETTDVTYADFTAASLTGTIVKRGGGTLTFDKNISTFNGPVHVEDGVAIGTCSNCFGRTVHGGGNANQRTYVHDGATLVLDAIGNKPKNAEANAVYCQGDGYPGMGGAWLWRNGNMSSGMTRWPVGCNSRAVGPAKIFLDAPSGGNFTFTYGRDNQPGTDFSACGMDVLIYGRTVNTIIELDAYPLQGIGNMVLSNMTLKVGGNSGRLIPYDGNHSVLHFRGGARWERATYDNLSLSQLGQTATLCIDDLEFMRITNGRGWNPWGGQTNNWWLGPVVLNGHLRCYNNNAPSAVGCTFSEQMRGPKGIRPWFASNGTRYGRGMRLNLLYPTNTFEGGIVLDGGSLGVWAEKAVPSQEGAGLVSITNGYVYFGRQGHAPSTAKWPEFTMPVTEFVGSGAVTNGTGVWQGLVKKGEGTLDYNSQLGGAYLDLQGGKVKFNTQYREEYAGDNATYAPDGYAAALPAFAKLKGTEGVLDLADAGGAYTVQDMEGTPSVTNGSLTVTGDWMLDVATLAAQDKALISGTLTFGAGSTVSITGDITTVPHAGGILVAKAGSVSGLPRSTCKGWALLESSGELRLYYVAGTTIIFR